MKDILNILLGAGVASIVPIATLFINSSNWQKEKRIEHLKIKYDRVEKTYNQIFELLPDAMKNNSHPVTMIAKILVNTSDEFREEYQSFMRDKGKTEESMRVSMLKFSALSQKHLLSIEQKIENILT